MITSYLLIVIELLGYWLMFKSQEFDSQKPIVNGYWLIVLFRTLLVLRNFKTAYLNSLSNQLMPHAYCLHYPLSISQLSNF